MMNQTTTAPLPTDAYYAYRLLDNVLTDEWQRVMDVKRQLGLADKSQVDRWEAIRSQLIERGYIEKRGPRGVASEYRLSQDKPATKFRWDDNYRRNRTGKPRTAKNPMSATPKIDRGTGIERAVITFQMYPDHCRVSYDDMRKIMELYGWT